MEKRNGSSSMKAERLIHHFKTLVIFPLRGWWKRYMVPPWRQRDYCTTSNNTSIFQNITACKIRLILSILALVNVDLFRQTGRLMNETLSSGSIRFDSIWFNLIWFHFISFHLIQFDSVQFNSIQFNLIQFNLIQFGSIWFNLIQFDSIWFNLIQFDSIRFDSIPNQKQKPRQTHYILRPPEESKERTKAIQFDEHIEETKDNRSA